MSPKFVPYQIEFSAVSAGKRVSSSKRKIRWRFGFSNQQALANGMTGTDCRGEEHDVTIVWSITSGKRQIMMDGQEVHYSTNRASIMEFSWQTKGNHVIKIYCHATPPMSATPGFRQYDMSIDGQSFFTMPKVFQLGIRGAVADQAPGAYSGNRSGSGMTSRGSFQNIRSDAPKSREQEEADLRRAIEASINESRVHLGEIPGGRAPAPAATTDLLGYGGPSAPPPTSYAPPPSDARSVASFYSAPPTYDHGFQSPPPPPPTYPATAAAAAPAPPSNAYGAIVPAVAPPGYYQAPPSAAAPAPPPAYASPPPVPPAYASLPPPQHAAYSSPPPVPPAPAPTPSADIFGLHTTPVDDPFAPKPPPPMTHQDLTNAVLGAYQSPPPAAAPQTPMADRYEATPATPQNGGVALSMNTLTIAPAADEKPKSDFEKALCNLVNIDHIDEPAEGEIKLTMMQKEEKRKKQIMGKSVPKPPVGMGMVGANAPLAQIRKDFQSPQNRSTEGVMNAPPPGVFSPNAAQGGMLVVHGQGPPPLQQASGFGVGAALPNGGFQNQQNLAPGQYLQQQRLYQ